VPLLTELGWEQDFAMNMSRLTALARKTFNREGDFQVAWLDKTPRRPRGGGRFQSESTERQKIFLEGRRAVMSQTLDGQKPVPPIRDSDC